MGAFGRGVMDPAFEQAAFALNPGQVSEPVRSRFGYHLIETTEVLPASIKPFEEVKAQLIAEVGKQEVVLPILRPLRAPGHPGLRDPGQPGPGGPAIGP